MATDAISAPAFYKQASKIQTLVCASCGVVCPRTGYRQKVCIECRKPKKKLISCKVCGTSVVERRGGRQFCSRRCSDDYENSQARIRRLGMGRRLIGSIDKCSICGGEYEVLGPASKYCNDCRKEAGRRKAKRYRKSDPIRWSKIQKRQDEGRRNDPARIEAMRRYAKTKNKKRTCDPAKNLHHRISQMVRHGLREGKESRSWTEILDFTIVDLIHHLERQFLPGMSWVNIGDWHIDHIIPRSDFQFSSAHDEDFKACWAITNLRPLWRTDNIKKGNKRLFLI